jgi:hypothetical protein
MVMQAVFFQTSAMLALDKVSCVYAPLTLLAKVHNINISCRRRSFSNVVCWF